ncbi:MAG TPA: MFS transporter [Bryobacteraceae bacterium]|nr:MFS transporter [Bryobacteraceae bacterium]
MASTLSARPANSSVRWLICGLLFLATVIAYVDRGILSFLEKYLEGVIGFTTVEYGRMTAAFQGAYALAFLAAGRLTDRLGIRKSFAIAIVLWSIAAMAPGAANSVPTFGIAMFFLGIGEAANFPVCIKTVAEWFPKKERALATGIFNSGANVGNLVVPLIVPFLTDHFTWRGAFVVGGSTGLVWLVLWLWIYARPEEHARVSVRELGHIQSDPPEKTGSVPWGLLLPRRETWAFAVAKLLTDPVWWFWTFWLPGYFQRTFHLSLGKSSAPIVAVYVACCVGSVAGGWISSAMLARGKSLNASRKTAMLICALCTLPVLYAPFSGNLWVVVALVGLAGAAHQGWSANVFTLASDLFPKAAVGSVVGIGAMAGAAAGFAAQLSIGYIVRSTYVPCFIFAGSAYVVSLVIVQLLSPKLAPAKLD